MYLKKLGLPAALLALLVFIPKGYAEPRDAFHLESRVPQSTLAVVTLEDIGNWEQKFDKTAIGAFFSEPEMHAFMEPIEKALTQMIEEREGPFGDVPPIAWDLLEQLEGLEGQLAVALIDVDLDEEMPSAVASLDFGSKIGDFGKFLHNMKAEMGDDGEAMRAFEKDGRTWWQVDADGLVISATSIDTAFVIATDPQLLQSVIDAPTGGEGSLASNADFKVVKAKSGGEQLGMFAYANVPAIVRMFDSKMDEETRAIANALGLDTVKGFGYGMSFVGDGFMDSLVIHTPGADHGILKLLEAPPMRPQMIDWAPSTAFYYSESAMSLDGLLGRVRELLAAVDEDYVEDMDEGLKEVNAQLGVDIEHELVAGLGAGACLYAAMPETGGLYPEAALMMTVKNADEYESVFDRFANGLAGMMTENGSIIASTRVIEYAGQRMHLFEMQEAEGDDVVPFTPTWAIMEGKLFVTAVPYAMKEIIARKKEQAAVSGAHGLASQEDFQTVLSAMPDSAGAIEYLDLQAIMNLLYDTAVPTLQTVVKPNMIPMPVPLDWAQLPPARTVRKYFRSLGAFTTWNQDGISISMHAPIPMMAMLMVSAGAGAAMLMGRVDPMMDPVMIEVVPSLGVPADLDAELAEVQAEEIAKYVSLYILEQKKMPATLADLVTADVMGALPKDPWGNDFKLRVLDAESRDFRIVSWGPDGRANTEDDVVAGEK